MSQISCMEKMSLIPICQTEGSLTSQAVTLLTNDRFTLVFSVLVRLMYDLVS